MIDNAELISHLREARLIDEARLQRGLELAEAHELSLYDALIEYALVEEHAIVRLASQLLNIPSINLRNQEIDTRVAHRIAASLAYRNHALPLRLVEEVDGAILLLAMADPFDMLAMDEIASHTGVHIRPVLAGPADLKAALQRVYQNQEDNIAEKFGLDEDSAPQFTASVSKDSAAESWAKFFDTAQSVGIDEDSSVISQEMRDRPPTDVFEDIDFDAQLVGDLSISSALDGSNHTDRAHVEISLDKWELDSAFTQEGARAKRDNLLSSDSIVEDDDNQRAFPPLSPPAEPGSAQLARIQVKRIAVPVAGASQSRVQRDGVDLSALDAIGSEELLRATVRLLLKKGVFTLEELQACLKSE